MARTIIGLNDAKAVKRYSAFLAVDTARISYWSRKFMGYGEEANTPVQMLTELENDAGEQISYDLNLQLKMQPVEGDDVLEGQEEDLKFYSDNVYIDQMRGGVNTGGRMTRKRTIIQLRKVSRSRQAEWWARVFDEIYFMYGTGARGINADYIFPTSYAGFANNAFTAPDTDHLVYAGDATAKNDLDANDIVDLALVDKLRVTAEVMGGGTQAVPQIQPIMIEGEEHYVFVMHPWAEYDMRRGTSAGDWVDVQKAAAGAEGRANPMFRGAMGMYNNVILHSHKGVIRYSDYGAGSNVLASRGLFLGSQAMVCAFGSPGTGLRFDWHEESRDNGNQAVITTSAIFGAKKCTFNSKDFGVIAVDMAAAAP